MANTTKKSTSEEIRKLADLYAKYNQALAEFENHLIELELERKNSEFLNRQSEYKLNDWLKDKGWIS